MKNNRSFVCPYPSLNLSLLNSGVKLCCWHNDAHKPEYLESIPIRVLWNSHYLQNARKKLSKGPYQCPGYCPVLNGCRDIFYPPEGLPTENHTGIALSVTGCQSKQDGPKVLQIDLSKSCNLNCIMCNNNFEDGSPILSEKALNRLVSEAYETSPGLLVILQGGEPFYKNKANAFAHRLSNVCPDIQWGFVTNLLHWTPKQIVDLNLAGFVVSIDGSCKQTYEYVRRGARWETLLKKLSKLIRFCGDSVPIQVNYTVMSSNVREMVPAADLFCRFGIKRLCYRPVLLPILHPEFIFSKAFAIELLKAQSQELMKSFGHLTDQKDLLVLEHLAQHFGTVELPPEGNQEISLWDSLPPAPDAVHL